MTRSIQQTESEATGSHSRASPKETLLAIVTLGLVCVYAPAETWVSRGALTSPGYIVDVIAFVLLGFGGVWLLRHSHSTGPISAAWGYCAALGWRSYFLRVHARVNDLPIYDNENMQIERLVGLAMVVAFVMLGWCMVISVLHTRAFRMSQQ